MSSKDASSLSQEARRRTEQQKVFNLIIWLLLLVAGVAVWWLFFRVQLTPELGVVKRGTARSVVYGTLEIEPIAQSLVKALSGGLVSVVNVKKGDLVKQNDVLAEINDPDANQLLDEANAELKIAQDAGKIGPASKPALDEKVSGMAQLDKLLKEGNIAQSEYDRNAAELKTLQEHLQNEQLTLDAAVESAQQKVDVAKMAIANRFVRATQDGVIIDFFSQLGQLVVKGEQMFEIGSQASQIRAKVGEEDVGLLQVGMPADVSLNSFPGQTFTAKLKQVLPGAVDQNYSVILTLDNPPVGLLPGMTGELNITTGVHENVLLIPRRALLSGLTPTVLIVADGIVQTREIQVGYHGLEISEVVSGLNEGDLVILSDQDLYKPGDRVKVIPPK